jgi:hypothetical protein
MMPTLRISRAELAAAAFALGVTNPAIIRKWFFRETIPYSNANSTDELFWR